MGKQFLMMMCGCFGDSNSKEDGEYSKVKEEKFAAWAGDRSGDLGRGANITYALKLALFFLLLLVRNPQLLPSRPPSPSSPLFSAFISEFVLPAVF